mgnify:CR=1 FL=1
MIKKKMTIQKRFFSQHIAFGTNSEDLDRLAKSLAYLRDKREKLKEEHDDLKSDKEVANVHRLALVKKENQQAVTEEEENAISDMKLHYTDFFDSDVEQSDSQEETSPEYKERKQVAGVINYINEELKSNSNQAKKIATQWNNIHKIMRERLSETGSMPESSSSANQVSTQISQSEAQTSQNEESNKQINPQINQTTSDYIDNLPKQYNPFDDLGED